MLATLKADCRLPGLFLLFLVLAAVCGCREPGPRALLKGERYLRDRQYEKALEELEKAVRLLPNHAQAWNHLGLAYHALQQPQQALKAYSSALRLDHKLAAVRFNLGCLLLEQNQTEGAIEELTSYTMVQPGSVQGWVQLGKAQLRGGKLSAAEHSFKAVLQLQPNHPEALNNLGVLQIQRQRPAEAMQWFNQVLTQHPEYAPAHYNAAVVSHQHFKNQSLALKRYQEYLAVEPRPTNWTEVSSLVQRLETDMHPIPLRPGVRDNQKPLTLASKLPPAPPVVPVKPKEIAKPPPKRTEPSIAAPTDTNQEQPGPPQSTFVDPLPVPPPPIEVVRPPEKETKPVQETHSSGPKPAPLVSAPPAKPSTPPHTASSTARPPAVPTTTDTISRTATATSEKAEASHPAETAPGPTKSETPPANPMASTNQSNVRTTAVVRVSSDRTSSPVSQSTWEDFRGSPGTGPSSSGISRYQYRQPVPGQPGDRAKAEVLFREGLKWHRSRRQALAVEQYQAAVQADPAYYEAYFNMGVAAFETADWQLCLASYEMAMALKPESLDVRYNFCVALQRANYPLDALRELKTLLQKNAKEARAHLAIANLYDQVFRDPKQAREHYIKVLELDPRHPEAQRIRLWLSTKR
jgi:Tfp pilus assembly protein PilF